MRRVHFLKSEKCRERFCKSEDLLFRNVSFRSMVPLYEVFAFTGRKPSAKTSFQDSVQVWWDCYSPVLLNVIHPPISNI